MKQWHVDIDLEATFPIDGRTETVYEITTVEHDETIAYGVSQDAAERIAALLTLAEGISTEALRNGTSIMLNTTAELSAAELSAAELRQCMAYATPLHELQGFSLHASRQY